MFVDLLVFKVLLLTFDIAFSSVFCFTSVLPDNGKTSHGLFLFLFFRKTDKLVWLFPSFPGFFATAPETSYLSYRAASSIVA